MKTTNYYILILNQRQEVKYAEVLTDTELKKAKYCIIAEFQRTSSTGKNAFFKYTVVDALKKPIDNNSIELEGIKCQIAMHEVWTLVKPPSHNGVGLAIMIKDKLDNEKEVIFDNTLHSEHAIKEVYQYINLLNKYGTHEAVEMYNSKCKDITRYKQRIEALKKVVSDLNKLNQ